MPPRLIIFDNDGVIVDSEPYSIGTMQMALARKGVHLTVKWCYDNMLGRRTSDIINSVRNVSDVPFDEDSMLQDYRALFIERADKSLKAMSGVKTLLKKFHRAHMEFCMATSAPNFMTAPKIKATGLMEYFNDKNIFSGDQVRHGKPAPDLFLLAARKMGATPGECVVVEDSLVGVQAGRGAGMRVIGFLGLARTLNMYRLLRRKPSRRPGLARW